MTFLMRSNVLPVAGPSVTGYCSATLSRSEAVSNGKRLAKSESNCRDSSSSSVIDSSRRAGSTKMNPVRKQFQEDQQREPSLKPRERLSPTFVRLVDADHFLLGEWYGRCEKAQVGPRARERDVLRLQFSCLAAKARRPDP